MIQDITQRDTHMYRYSTMTLQWVFCQIFVVWVQSTLQTLLCFFFDPASFFFLFHVSNNIQQTDILYSTVHVQCSTVQYIWIEWKFHQVSWNSHNISSDFLYEYCTVWSSQYSTVSTVKITHYCILVNKPSPNPTSNSDWDTQSAILVVQILNLSMMHSCSSSTVQYEVVSYTVATVAG